MSSIIFFETQLQELIVVRVLQKSFCKSPKILKESKEKLSTSCPRNPFRSKLVFPRLRQRNADMHFKQVKKKLFTAAKRACFMVRVRDVGRKRELLNDSCDAAFSDARDRENCKNVKILQILNTMYNEIKMIIKYVCL